MVQGYSRDLISSNQKKIRVLYKSCLKSYFSSALVWVIKHICLCLSISGFVTLDWNSDTDKGREKRFRVFVGSLSGRHRTSIWLTSATWNPTPHRSNWHRVALNPRQTIISFHHKLHVRISNIYPNISGLWKHSHQTGYSKGSGVIYLEQVKSQHFLGNVQSFSTLWTH